LKKINKCSDDQMEMAEYKQVMNSQNASRVKNLQWS